MKKITFFLILFLSGLKISYTCTNIAVTRGASIDGSVMVSYNVDSPGHFYPFFFTLAKDHKPGDMFRIVEWTTGKYLGEIPEVPHTYKVIEHMNEFQVSVTETTLGTSHRELVVPNGILDYGNMMYLGLLRSKTARECIKIMTDLLAQYGWASDEPESIYISDKNEVWIMEVYGKGKGEKGAIWVALRVPDGYICAHANKARIRTFDMNDKENCMYASDVVTFAEKKGWYNKERHGAFDLTNVYAPDEPRSLLACEGRVWSIFNMAAPSLKLSSKYFRAFKGEKPYPLFIKPDKKLSAQDVIKMCRDRFEGTEWDYSKHFITTAFNSTVIKRPLIFKAKKGKDTVNCIWPRPIAVPQAAFVFVAQSRTTVPDELGVQWFATDDPKTAVFMPIYCGIQKVPTCLATGQEKIADLTSAHWMFNLVANYTYFSGYTTMLPLVLKVQSELESDFFEKQISVEEKVMDLIKNNLEHAKIYLTEYCQTQSANVMKRWNNLLLELLVKYHDGNEVDLAPIRTKAKGLGYTQEIFQKAFDENPDWYEIKWK